MSFVLGQWTTVNLCVQYIFHDKSILGFGDVKPTVNSDLLAHCFTQKGFDMGAYI